MDELLADVFHHFHGLSLGLLLEEFAHIEWSHRDGQAAIKITTIIIIMGQEVEEGICEYKLQAKWQSSACKLGITWVSGKMNYFHGKVTPWRVYNYLACHTIPFYGNLTHETLPLLPILSQFNTIYIFRIHFSKNYYNILPFWGEQRQLSHQ